MFRDHQNLFIQPCRLGATLPVIPALRRQRQEDCYSLKVNQAYIARYWPAKVRESLSQKRKKEKNKERKD